MLDKVISMLLDLLNKERVTARQLADKLEVSVRTIYRYLDVLSLANIPVFTQKGRYGGIKLGDEFRIGSMYFSKAETDCVIAALNAFNTDVDIKIAHSAKCKLSAISRTSSDSSCAAYRNEHFVVDNKDMRGNSSLQAKIDNIIYAKENKVALSIHYHDYNGEITERIVEPYTVVYHDNCWYVYCYCRLRRGMRLFKISRITHMYITDSAFAPVKHERGWHFDFEQLPADIDVVLKVDKDARYEVEEWLGVENVKLSDNGTHYIAYGTVPDNKDTYTRIIGMAGNVAIISPPELKDKISSLCRKSLDTV